MARIIQVGEPVNDAERMVLRHLRDHAPAEWTVVSNFELSYGHGRQVFEVDLAILTEHACYLADTKGAHGRIEVRGARWYPHRRQPYPSPVRKCRDHAKILGQLLRRRSRSGAGVSVWCEPLVILPFEDAVLRDPGGLDEPCTVRLRDLVPYLTQHRPTAAHSGPPIAGVHDDIVRALRAEARPASGSRQFGRYEVVETLAEADPSVTSEDPYDPYENVSVYRVRKRGQPTSGTYLLQVHAVDPLLPEADLAAAYTRISTPIQAHSRLKASQYIVACVDDFPVHDETGYAVVLEDVHADALRVRLTDGPAALGADARRRVMSGVLAGLAHAHAKRVVHRGLTPDTVLVDRDGEAMLTGFDFAYPGEPRGAQLTVRQTALERHDAAYLAPEVRDNPDGFSPASDMYAAGALFHELYAGEPPSVGEGDGLDEVPGLEREVRYLIRRLLDADPRRRPEAREAIELVDRRRAGQGAGRGGAEEREDDDSFDWDNPHNYAHLPAGFRLTEKFRVRAKLGQGQFGVVYRVFNTLDDTDEVLKIMTGGGVSVEERLRGEYRILRQLPPHPNLVPLIDAEWLPKGGFQYLRMEFAEGQDLQTVIGGDGRRSGGRERPLGPADVRRLLEDCLAGLAHLHANGVYHCDIKPSNLLWTPDGTKLLDFNAAVSAGSTLTPTLGSPKFIAPGAMGRRRPTVEDLTDLDLYALGVSAYMALTGAYPWRGRESPPKDEEAPDPRDIAGFADLSPAFAAVLRRAISPRRAERFADTEAFLAALRAAGDVRLTPRLTDNEDTTAAGASDSGSALAPEGVGDNPFVARLQTLYSQNSRTNSGTRGLDPAGFPLYVETALDTELTKAVLRGDHRLVIITGNAGDGKTAFLQNLAETAAKKGADAGQDRPNGSEFTYRGRLFRTNHDGSQDEGDTDNDAVLDGFLAPYRGDTADAWPEGETRLLAVNEGRLTDFVTHHEDRYPLLAHTVREGLATGQEAHSVVVINLNARDVFADPYGTGSIMRRMVEAMTDERHWTACASCTLAPRCYALHNARTFTHPTAGPQIVNRLAALHRMAQLRGRLHVTLRDLRSALAYTLTSARDCAQIHTLYERGADSAQERLDSFYFTSWAGLHTGADAEHDRFLTQLRDLDMATVPDPQLDRRLDYTGPSGGHSLISVDQRGGHDEELLQEFFAALPRTPEPGGRQLAAHRAYLGAARRRFFFESLDDIRWSTMLSYQSGDHFLGLLDGALPVEDELVRLIEAISRGEGMPYTSDASGPDLALQVRTVRGGTVRSHRLFPAGRFTLDVRTPAASDYVEKSPRELVMRYRPDDDGPQHAQLVVRLDLYELLDRLYRGHQSGVEDRQGQNLALAVFKNALSATSTQEVLLSAPGSPPYRLSRQPGGTLRLAPARDGRTGDERRED
ncbi:protein kinase [Streptomyces sp. NBC_00038]|uniref:methylation-associated defense system protein kinase MAD6 n=1 Tax=Streptomyces sp. NBC_00038 TaxID=2903615 RepID=UPI00224E1843|nr:protein kinase [Streptomyces sp. NBC_00038]MCX5560286.1 protein kinase [Streptomyces sp. NBC_00038]